VHQIHGRHDTYRHGAVRVGDAVAVTLINVSATHRAHALGLALHAQQDRRIVTDLLKVNLTSLFLESSR
jgi:hypothetical protein